MDTGPLRFWSFCAWTSQPSSHRDPQPVLPSPPLTGLAPCSPWLPRGPTPPHEAGACTQGWQEPTPPRGVLRQGGGLCPPMRSHIHELRGPGSSTSHCAPRDLSGLGPKSEGAERGVRSMPLKRASPAEGRPCPLPPGKACGRARQASQFHSTDDCVFWFHIVIYGYKLISFPAEIYRMFLSSPFEFSCTLSFPYLSKAAIICHKKQKIVGGDEFCKLTPEIKPQDVNWSPRSGVHSFSGITLCSLITWHKCHLPRKIGPPQFLSSLPHSFLLGTTVSACLALVCPCLGASGYS